MNSGAWGAASPATTALHNWSRRAGRHGEHHISLVNDWILDLGLLEDALGRQQFGKRTMVDHGRSGARGRELGSHLGRNSEPFCTLPDLGRSLGLVGGLASQLDSRFDNLVLARCC